MSVWGDLGLFLTPPASRIPAGGWRDCLNVRLFESRVSSRLMGWEKYLTQQLNGPVMLIDEFAPTGGSKKLVFASLKDLYQNTPGSATVTYITPRYNTGTAARTGAAVTGTGTTWSTNVKAGDFMHFGNATQDSISATWHEVLTVNSNTSITLVGSPAGSDADGVYTIRQTLTSTVFNNWSTEVFPRAGHVGPPTADRWYGTNGVDSVVEWDGTTTAVTKVSTTLGFTCTCLRRYKNMMLYGNITTTAGQSRPFEMRNSLPGFPLDMVTVGAGVFTVAPTIDRILRFELLGDECAIYTNLAIVMAQFTEAPIYFIFRTTVTNTGLLASRFCANFGDHHKFLGKDAEYHFNGVQAVTVNTHIWTDALKSFDAARGELGHVAVDEQFGDCIWTFPTTADAGVGGSGPADNALTEHYLESISTRVLEQQEEQFHPYGKRQFPFHCVGRTAAGTTLTWDQVVGNWEDQDFHWNDPSLNSAFPLLLAGTADGFIMSVNTVDAQNGVGFASFVQFAQRTTMESPRSPVRGKGLVARVYPLVDIDPVATYDLIVTTTVYNHINEPGSSTVQSFPLTATGNRFVVPYRRGVWFDVQFGTQGSAGGQPWMLQGYDVDIRPAGER